MCVCVYMCIYIRNILPKIVNEQQLPILYVSIIANRSMDFTKYYTVWLIILYQPSHKQKLRLTFIYKLVIIIIIMLFAVRNFEEIKDFL